MQYFSECQAFLEGLATVLTDSQEKTTSLVYFECMGAIKMSIFQLDGHCKIQIWGFFKDNNSNSKKYFSGCQVVLYRWDAMLAV